MIETKEFVARRDRVLKELKGAVGLVMAGDHAGHGEFLADANFRYLTGLKDESGAAVLFDGANPDPRRRVVLFLKASNPEAEQWTGMRPAIDSGLKARLGIETIMRVNSLPATLTAALRRTKRAACLMPFAVYPAAASGDLAAFQQVTQRMVGASIEDRTGMLLSHRAVHSPAELKLIERAATISVEAYRRMIPMIKPGVNEGQVQLALETSYKEQGGGVAYGTIVGGGLGGTVLHYVANDQPLVAGDLLVIDSAASYGGYASDITRTFPVSGKFTSEQRELYEVVLAAELAGIKAAKPGARMFEVDAAAREVITKAGLGDYFIHSIGHPLGLTVHDVVPDHPLAAGMVLTIEPGIYLPDRKLGIRIEDDIVLTKPAGKGGNRIVTGGVPKTVKEIEAAMGR